MTLPDPFLLDGPSCISFSGGRTSAYMLRRILDAHGGALPPDAHVVFANTGKERPETLDFVRDCAKRWNVNVRWIEWRILRLDRTRKESEIAPRWLRWIDGDKGPADYTKRVWTETVAEVTYETASRAGEPFSALIDWKQYLPNPVGRMCTQHLKIEAIKLFLMDTIGLTEWDTVIGIRADEPKRHRIIGRDARNPRETKIAPLVDAHVDVADVMRFWGGQPFDLHLMPHEGNCDLCFLKGRARIERMLRSRPDLADWWIAQEAKKIGKTANGARFRANRPGYASMLDKVRSLPMLPGFEPDDPGDYAPDCACTD